MHVTEERTGISEFPDNTSGKFNLDEYETESRFRVVVNTNQQQSSSSPNPFFNPPSINRRVSSSQSSSIRRSTLAVVKVVRADLDPNGKPINCHRYNLTTHVPIYNDDQANLLYIVRNVRTQMEESDLEIVGPNGMRYYDEEGTRGIAFWKIGSRKLYAVRKQEIEILSDAASLRNIEQESDEENFLSPLARKRKSKKKQEDSELLQEVKKIRQSVHKILSTSRRHNLDIGFLNTLNESFSCCVCKVFPPNLPLLACRACSSLLGCGPCIDAWYNGNLSKKCPKCREPRGLSSTFIMKGLDEFLHKSRNLFPDVPEEQNEVISAENDHDDDDDDDDGDLPEILSIKKHILFNIIKNLYFFP